MLAMGLPLRPVNTPLAGAPDFGWDFAGWPVHTTVTTSAMTRSEVGPMVPPALCRCDGHPLHLRALCGDHITCPGRLLPLDSKRLLSCIFGLFITERYCFQQNDDDEKGA